MTYGHNAAMKGAATRRLAARALAEAKTEAAAEASGDRDTFFWKQPAKTQLFWLARTLGSGNYALWYELHKLGSRTWKDKFQAADHANHHTAETWQELECFCNGVTPPCEVCQAQARLSYDEISTD